MFVRNRIAKLISRAIKPSVIIMHPHVQNYFIKSK